MSIVLRRKPRSSLDPESALRVGRVSTFIEALERLPATDDSVYFFRGHSRFSYSLLPSIYRNLGWISNEEVLFKELVLRCPNDFSSVESTFQTLVRMQHYSLPTRLLDITINPLIALYFASEKSASDTESGEVVVLQVPKKELKYFDSDTVSVISNISRRPSSFTSLDQWAGEPKIFNSDPQIERLLHEIKKEKPYFLPRIEPADLKRVVCVKPKLDNARIIRQDGAFLLFGIGKSKLDCAEVPKEFRPNLPFGRIIIKHSEKTEIRKQLRALGITQSTVFPEIDRVAQHITELYRVEPEA